jgi:hypothetical protein
MSPAGPRLLSLLNHEGAGLVAMNFVVKGSLDYTRFISVERTLRKDASPTWRSI